MEAPSVVGRSYSPEVGVLMAEKEMASPVRV